MPNNLPNPIPAESVVFVPDENGEYRDTDEASGGSRGGIVWEREFSRMSQNKHYNRTPITAPLHHLTPEMVEAVCIAQVALLSPNPAVRDNAWGQLTAAFAHVLTPPVAKEPTVREKMDVFKTTNEIRLADAIDALSARLDKAGI